MTTFPIGAAAAGALVRVIGDTWSPVFTFTQTSGGPFDLTGTTATVEFYIAAESLPIATLTEHDGLAIIGPGRVRATIGPQLTGRATPADPVAALSFPTRALCILTDAASGRRTRGLVLYCPVSGRSAPALPGADDDTAVIVGEQGPPGITVTVGMINQWIADELQAAIAANATAALNANLILMGII